MDIKNEINICKIDIFIILNDHRNMWLGWSG